MSLLSTASLDQEPIDDADLNHHSLTSDELDELSTDSHPSRSNAVEVAALRSYVRQLEERLQTSLSVAPTSSRSKSKSTTRGLPPARSTSPPMAPTGRMDGTTHCSYCQHWAAVTTDLASFVETDVAATSSVGHHLLGVAEVLALQKQQLGALAGSLHAVLQNFRAEVDRREQAHRQHLQALEEVLEEQRRVNAAQQAALQVWQQSVEERVEQRLADFLETNEKRLLQPEVVAQEGGWRGWVEGRVKEGVQQQAAASNQAATARVEELASHITQSLKAQRQGVTEELAALRQEVMSELDKRRHTSHTTTMTTVERIEKERDTRDAAVDRELKALRHQMQSHGEALIRVKHLDVLDGAFTEVKDWLADVELRMMTRGEVQEAVDNLEAELFELQRRIKVVGIE